MRAGESRLDDASSRGPSRWRARRRARRRPRRARRRCSSRASPSAPPRSGSRRRRSRYEAPDPPTVEALDGAARPRPRARDDVARARTCATCAIAPASRDLRSFGSQGEQRTAVLALVLAEADLLAERRGAPPLLLLDDVLSELDAGAAARSSRAAGRRPDGRDRDGTRPRGAGPSRRSSSRSRPGRHGGMSAPLAARSGWHPDPIGEPCVGELAPLRPRRRRSATSWRPGPRRSARRSRANAWPARIARDGTLHVATTSSVWAFELTQLEATILERLAGAPRRTRAGRDPLRAGPLPEPGADSGASFDRACAARRRESARRRRARSPRAIEDEALREAVARAAAASLAARSRPGRPVVLIDCN